MILFNNEEVTFKAFPNGETLFNVEVLNFNNDSSVTNKLVLKFQDDSDLIKLMFTKKYLDTILDNLTLVISYMPYSRMDRVENNSPFTLKYVCKFINELHFKNVIVLESHSDVSVALLDNCCGISTSIELLSRAKKIVGFDTEVDYVYYPDASAEKHFGKKPSLNSLIGLKQRNFQTGKITKLDVVGNMPKTKGFKVIMVDDLCSYGGTFIMGAEKLIEIGADQIYLVVTHCEDSIFKGRILTENLINGVFTTNSMIRSGSHAKITEFDINEFIK